MIERCPIYTCKKFLGCGMCRALRKVCVDNLHVISTSHRNSFHTIDSIQRAKSKGEIICLETEKAISREVVWELSYSEHNILQVNLCLLEPFEEIGWAIELVHLTEICGIRCNLMLFPIIPTFVQVSDVLRIIDSVNNCNHCKIILKFGEFMKYEPTVSKKFLTTNKKAIPMEYLMKYNKNLYKCSNLYTEEFFQLVKFYTDNTKLQVVIL